MKSLLLAIVTASVLLMGGCDATLRSDVKEACEERAVVSVCSRVHAKGLAYKFLKEANDAVDRKLITGADRDLIKGYTDKAYSAANLANGQPDLVLAADMLELAIQELITLGVINE